jgi:hypothetical protein
MPGYTEIMENIWFKAKTHGWGWTPVAWQGWAVVALYVAAVAGAARFLLHDKPTTIRWIEYGSTLVLATALLIAVCFKTGEKPAWRWGGKK